MAEFQVATIGGPTDDVAKSVQIIEGVKKVTVVDGAPNTLVVAIEGESGPILGQIGRVPGVIYARPAGE